MKYYIEFNSADGLSKLKEVGANSFIPIIRLACIFPINVSMVSENSAPIYMPDFIREYELRDIQEVTRNTMIGIYYEKHRASR